MTKHKLPAVTVDMVVFTITKRSELSVLTITRRDDPFKGHRALPGGFVDVGGGYRASTDQGESVDAAAARELHEETGLDLVRDGVHLEQLYTFGDPGRDPRGRVISVAYLALVGMDVAQRIRAGDDAATVEWGPVEEWSLAKISTLAFDHGEILHKALERVRGKIDYDPRIARALLPPEWTLSEFRRVHEIVKGVKYDPANFRKRFKRMVEDGKMIAMNPKSVDEPRLYRFKEPE